MVKCPWCSKEVKDYVEHLYDEHYKEENGKIVGPFPAGERED
jgi:hypothetical protein